MLTIHIFRCSIDPTLRGFTQDRTGSNLPAHMAEEEWAYLTTIQVRPGQDRVGMHTDALLRDVQERGYHLARSGHPILPE